MASKYSSPMRLPTAVRAAALVATGGARLQDEHDRTVWMGGRLPAPEVLGLFHAFGDDWLLTRAMPGVPLHDRSLGWEPSIVARRLGEILRDIHAVDAAGCTFGRPGKGHLLIHGDYCLPNVLVEEGRLSGLIDLGGAGLGDPQDDLAAGVWTLQYNYGPGHAREFLDAYGWPPMSEKSIERLRRRYGR